MSLLIKLERKPLLWGSVSSTNFSLDSFSAKQVPQQFIGCARPPIGLFELSSYSRRAHYLTIFFGNNVSASNPSVWDRTHDLRFYVLILLRGSPIELRVQFMNRTRSSIGEPLNKIRT